MAHSIRDLIKNVPDINTGNRYMVEIFLPELLRSWNGQLDTIQFYCKECTIPQNGVTQIESRVYGQKKSIASIKESGNTNTSFIFDYKGINVKMFYAWSDIMMDPDTKRLYYYDDYVGRVRITLLNNLNKPIFICNLEEAYPLKISEIPLSYNQNEVLPIEIEWWFRTLSYTNDSDLNSLIESSSKEGVLSNGEKIISSINPSRQVQNIVNTIENAVESIRPVDRIPGIRILV